MYDRRELGDRLILRDMWHYYGAHVVWQLVNYCSVLAFSILYFGFLIGIPYPMGKSNNLPLISCPIVEHIIYRSNYLQVVASVRWSSVWSIQTVLILEKSTTRDLNVLMWKRIPSRKICGLRMSVASRLVSGPGDVLLRWDTQNYHRHFRLSKYRYEDTKVDSIKSEWYSNSRYENSWIW